MTHRHIPITLAFAIAILPFAVRAAEPKLDDLLKQIPAPSAAEGMKVSQALVALGEPGIAALAKRLTPAGKGDDTQPRMALHGMAIYVSRPGAAAERKAFAQAVAKQLALKLNPQVKSFLIEQLQLAGGPEAVAALAPSLMDETQCAYAAQALLAIRTGAAEAFAKALPQAKGACQRTIMQALGVLHARGDAQSLLQAAASEDRETRLAAIFALAEAGAPAGVDAVKKCMASKDYYEREKATEACLIMARRLAAKGQQAEAEKLLRGLMAESNERQARCAGLSGLAQASGAAATDVILAALGDQDPQLRATARREAIHMPGQAATARWVKALAQATPAAKVEILSVLAGRGDKAALPNALAAMKDKDESVRVAAIQAAGAIGGEAAVPTLVAKLSAGKAESAAAVAALKAMPGSAATAAIAAAQPKAAAASRVALLGVLAGRGAVGHLPSILAAAQDKDESVRIAAFAALGRLVSVGEMGQLLDLLVKAKPSKVQGAAERAAADACGRVYDKNKAADLIVARLPNTAPAAKCALLRVSKRTGSSKAVPALREALRDKNPDVQNAAIRTLAEWPNASVARDLLGLARTSKNDVHKILALRGYVRVIGLKSGRPGKRTVQMLEEAMKLAQRLDEKKLVLGGLGKVKHPAAMNMALRYLEEPTLKNEAAAAVVSVAKQTARSHTFDALKGVKQVLAAKVSPRVIKQAKDVLSTINETASYVTAWMVSGPYMQKGKSGTQLLDMTLPPEGPAAKDVKWKLMPQSKDRKRPWLIDLDRVMRGSNRVGYLRTYVWADAPTEALLELGSDDGIKVWLNGKVVHEKNVPRSLTPNEDKVKIQLAKGWNTLLLKVMNLGGGFNASARLRAVKDGVMEPVRTSVDKE